MGRRVAVPVLVSAIVIALAAVALLVWPGHLLRGSSTQGASSLTPVGAVSPAPGPTAPPPSNLPALPASPGPSAPVPPPVPPTPPAPPATGVDGLWEGTYTCSQGLTGVTINIAPAGKDKVTALFEFYAVPKNPGVPTGSATMTGDLTGSKLTLRWTKWLVQPSGYVPVTFAGGVAAGGRKLTGRITSASQCTTFQLTRVNAQAAPAAGTDLAGLWDDRHGTIYRVDALGSGSYRVTTVANAGYLCEPADIELVGSGGAYLGTQDLYGNLNGGRPVGVCGGKSGTGTIVMQVADDGMAVTVAWPDVSGTACGKCTGVVWGRVLIAP